MQDKTIRIAALGDIMLDRKVGRHYREHPEDFSFDKIAAILSKYDIVLANLENPVGIRGKPHPDQDPNVAFRCHPKTLNVLKNLNVNVVTLANNHLLDYGKQTLKDTLRHLDEVDIQHIGGGKDYNEANQPAFFNINGQSVAILSSVMIYSASTERATKKSGGVADHNINALIKKVKKLKKNGCLVIVTIHWGIEYCFYPLPYQQMQARRLIDSGASLIIGHGPHYPQGIETYGNGEIVHSLGNFIFDEPFYYANKSFIYGCTLRKNSQLTERKIYPVTLSNHLPILDRKGELSRTGVLVNHLNEIYSRKNRAFWNKINNRWFSNIVWRISTMNSWKFAFLPPTSFYLNILKNEFFNKLNYHNVKWLLTRVIHKFLHRNENAKHKTENG